MEQSRYFWIYLLVISREKKIQTHFTTKTKEGIPKRIAGIRENFNKHPNEDGNFLVQKVLLFTSTLAAHGSVVQKKVIWGFPYLLLMEVLFLTLSYLLQKTAKKKAQYLPVNTLINIINLGKMSYILNLQESKLIVQK